MKNLMKVKLVALLIIGVSVCSCNFNKKPADNSTEKVVHKAPKMDIHTAAFMGDVKNIKKHIAAKSDLNAKDQYGSTPLAIATTFNKVQVAIALINGGADINCRSSDGSTPLHTSAFLCRVELVDALLKAGADKTLRNNYGATALESVSPDFADVKGFYDEIGKSLGPLGLKLDYDYIKKTRPIIAEMLK